MSDEEIADLVERVEEAESRASDAMQNAIEARDMVGQLRAELADANDRIDELEVENKRLRERTELLQRVRKASALKPEERAAVLIQTLYNDARAHEDDGLAPKAKLTTKQSKTALGGGVSRSIAWQAMQKAVELVDEEGSNQPLSYVKKSRSATENSHLLLDLRDGDVPEVVAGVDITATESTGGVATGD